MTEGVRGADILDVLQMKPSRPDWWKSSEEDLWMEGNPLVREERMQRTRLDN